MCVLRIGEGQDQGQKEELCACDLCACVCWNESEYSKDPLLSHTVGGKAVLLSSPRTHSSDLY